jgi:hypothetical protein
MKINTCLRLLFMSAFVFLASQISFSQETDAKAEAVLSRSVAKLGGNNYTNVKTIVGRGLLAQFTEESQSYQTTFLDILVLPNKERTEFKTGGLKTVQANFDGKGWMFDGGPQTIRDQSPQELEGFGKSLRTSIDYLLRRNWVGNAKLSYVGRREASLGKRNEVVKLTFTDDFVIEYEFSAADGLPSKIHYKRKNITTGEESKEEDRYAQFVEIQGVLVPFVIDHFRDGKQSSRINYQSVEFNKTVSESVFSKPTSPKEFKKDLKF